MYRHRFPVAALVIGLFLLAALPVQAYVLLPFNWAYLGGNPVTVDLYVNPNCADASAPNELASLQSAMGTWTSDSGANFEYNYAGPTSVTSSNYWNFQNDICWNAGSSGGALATTSIWYNGGNITQADTEFWDVWTWSTGTPGFNQYDVESVGLHEIGHTLGLDHTPISAAVMYYAIGWGQVKRSLHSDDIAGILAIYGSAGGPDLTVTLTPTGSVNIPGSGGTIPYDIDIHNNSGSTINFDGWTGIEEVGGGYSEEMIVRTGLSIGGGGTISRSLNLYISGSVPNGTYDYYARLGTYSSTIIAEDSFQFFKYGDDAGSPWVEKSYSTWWDDEIAVQAVVPETFTVSGAYPNPFNPETSIAFDLPQVTHVNLTIYNLRGQKVVELLEGTLDAGKYHAVWNASGQASGTYIYRLNTDLGTASGKLVLLK